jgi:alpha-methylacyl-CoA racemase
MAPQSAATPRGKEGGDLSGVTVLDLAGLGPASRCIRVLADLGARGIRIVPPTTAARIDPPWYSYGAFRGAEAVRLDLKQPAGRDVFLRLTRHADVIIEGFRPGVADRLGIGYETVRKTNGAIIYCALSGYGQAGPYAQTAGHDLNYSGLAGALATGQRRSDGGPAVPGVTLADSAGGGWQAAIRILAALFARRESGTGRYLDVATAEGVLQLMSLTLDEYLATGAPPTPGGSLLTGGFACYQLYETADGQWLAVAAIESSFFANLCEAMGISEWASRQFDQAAQIELQVLLADRFRTRTRAEWMGLLGHLDVCVSPVLSIAEVTEDVHWKARGVVGEFDHPERGSVRQLRPFGGGTPAVRGDVPAVGAAVARVLGDAGFTDEEIRSLLQEGVVA